MSHLWSPFCVTVLLLVTSRLADTPQPSLSLTCTVRQTVAFGNIMASAYYEFYRGSSYVSFPYSSFFSFIAPVRYFIVSCISISQFLYQKTCILTNTSALLSFLLILSLLPMPTDANSSMEFLPYNATYVHAYLALASPQNPPIRLSVLLPASSPLFLRCYQFFPFNNHLPLLVYHGGIGILS